MTTISFDTMCREVFKCENYIEWEDTMEIRDHGRDYVSTNTWVSCTKVGKSCNIDEYPEDCPHKVALDLYTVEKEEANRRFEKKCEQEKIWKRLNDVNS